MKMKVTTGRRLQRQATRRPCVKRRDTLRCLLVGIQAGVGKWFDGDLVAERFELSDGACLGLGGNAPGEVIRPGFAIELTVGEHVPRGNDHRVFDGYQRSHRPAPHGDTPVLRPEVGFLPPNDRQCSDAQRALEVRVPGPGLRRLDPARRLVGSGREPAPRRQMPRGREHAHVGAGFGDEHLSHDPGNARDAHQQLPGRRKRLHRCLDPDVQACDVC
jgi:hypothetical protein